jgi:hypothetical protein
MFRGPIIGVLALAGVTAVASAQDTAFVVTRDLQVHRSATQLRVNPHPGFVQIGHPQRDAVGLIHQPVLVREATVDPRVSATPALPHLARVQMGTQTILVDPNVNYLSKAPGRIDENHSIVRAQRMFNHLASQGGRTYFGQPRQDAIDPAEIRPSAVILRPNLLDEPQRHPRDGMPITPAPAPQKREGEPKKMAMAQ